jgi:hypothetical protein
VTSRTLAALLVVAIVACSRRDEPATAPSGPTRLVVAFTGEDLGRIEPCGCTSAMLGGLARRPARLRTCVEPGVPFAYVSGGRLVAGADEYDRLRLRTILRALRVMDCATYSPADERYFGLDRVAAMAREAGVPTAIDGPVKLPTGEVAAYALGVITWNGAQIGAARAKLPAGAALVVLTDADLGAARELARDVAGPTLVLYAAGRAEPRDADVTPGGVAVAPYPARGEFVGVARLVGDAWTVEYRPVLHDLPEDPTLVAQRMAHLAEMRAEEIVRKSATSARFAVGATTPPGDDRFVGNESCATCHAAAAKTWAASKHAKAMASLVATGDDVDPGCVRCHVVGYGTGRGFVDAKATSRLADVGCEACHGPREDHVAARRDLRVDPRRASAGEGSCLGCHDSEHDPNFDFATYWPRIAHDAK